MGIDPATSDIAVRATIKTNRPVNDGVDVVTKIVLNMKIVVSYPHLLLITKHTCFLIKQCEVKV